MAKNPKCIQERLQYAAAAAAAKSLQSCLTLCDPIDGSPPVSPVLGFSRQAYWSGVPLPSPRLQYKYHILQAIVLPLARHGNTRGICENLNTQAPHPQTIQLETLGIC